MLKQFHSLFLPKTTFSSIGPVQLNFLRLLSDRATQNFTYHCSGGVAWYDADNDNYDSAITFLGSNGDELAYGSDFEPRVIKDDCQV